MHVTIAHVAVATGVVYAIVIFFFVLRFLLRAALLVKKTNEKNINLTNETFIAILNNFLGILHHSLVCIFSTLGNAAALALSRWQLYVFTAVLVGAGAITFQFHTEIIVEVDYLWSTIIWFVMEPVKHFLNFFRLFASSAVGFWDAVALLYRLPARIAVRAVADCDITISGITIDFARLVANFTKEFFLALAVWAQSGLVKDFDVSKSILSIREFVQTLINLAACACDDKSFNDTLQVFAYPAYAEATDTVIASLLALFVRALSFPFAVVTKPATTGVIQLPIHDFIDLAVRKDGLNLFSSSAELFNDWGQEISTWLQVPMKMTGLPTLDFPPIFSFLHHIAAALLEAFRIFVQIFESLPVYVFELLNYKVNNARVIMQKALVGFPMFEHLRLASDALFVDCIAVVDKFMRSPEKAVGVDVGTAEFGEAFNTCVIAIAHTLELFYNASVDFVVGHPDYITKPVRDGCELKLIEEPPGDIIFTRAWNVAMVLLGRWYDIVLPYYQKACSFNGAFLAGFYVPFGETFAQFCLSLLHEFDAFVWSGGYAVSRQIFGTTILSTCIEGFYETAHDHERSFLAVLPTFVTAMLDLTDTQKSGYATLACAQTTYRNHVYAGSLKVFIFANEACEASRDMYGHPERRGAYSDFNSNTLCASSDGLMAVAETFITQNRYTVEQVAGILEIVSRCIGDISGTDCVQGPIKKQLELLSLEFDVLTCLLAEFLYRLSEIAVSVLSPAIDLVYDDYPDDGYVVAVGNEFHVQAKPIQASLITWLMSFFGAVHYAYRFMTFVNKKLIEVTEMFFDLVAGRRYTEAMKTVFEEMLKYRFEVNAMAVRSVILFVRDTLVATLQVARAVTTVEHWSSAAQKSEPNLSSKSFTDFQKSMMSLINLVQLFAQFLEEKFWKGLERAFEAFYLLLDALMNLDKDSMLEFFEYVFKEMESFLKEIAEGFWMLISDETSGLGIIIKHVCSAINVLKDGVCSVLSSKWLPTGFTIKCGTEGQKSCWWLPGGTIGMNANNKETITSEISTPFTLGVVFEDEMKLSFSNNKLFIDKPDLFTKNVNDPGYPEYAFTIYIQIKNLNGWEFFTLLGANGKKEPFEFSGISFSPFKNGTPLSIPFYPIPGVSFRIAVEVNGGFYISNTLSFSRRHLMGGDVPIIDDAIGLANDAVKLGNKAWNAAKDVAEKIKDVWSEIEKMANKIVESAPTKFSLQTSSITEIAGISLDCGEIDCKKKPSVELPNRPEPTVCFNEAACDVATATCWTPFQKDCPLVDTGNEADDKITNDLFVNWANACNCKNLKTPVSSGSKNYHCNFATGFCEAGSSPFVKSLSTCPPSGAQLMNTVCRVSEAWKCAGKPDEIECRIIQARNAERRLCRAFCDELPHMDGNSLTTFKTNDANAQCVCEIGADRLFLKNITIFADLTPRRRNLLQTRDEEDEFFDFNHSNVYNGQSENNFEHDFALNGTTNATHHAVYLGRGVDNVTGFSICVRNADCFSRNVTYLRICRSLWGSPIPCFSCSERAHSFTWGDDQGYRCDAETRTCMCNAPPKDAEYTDEMVDSFEWRGNSWCDRIMNGYHTHAVTTPIERASLLRCTLLRSAGQSVVQMLGVPTVPPDIFYNPSRALWIAYDLFEGLISYFTEGWNDKPVEDFFATLVDRRVDPVLVFKVLDFAQRTVRDISGKVMNSNVTGAIESVIEAVSPEASRALHETFELAKNLGQSPDFQFTELSRLTTSAAIAAAPMARFAYHMVKNAPGKRRLLVNEVTFSKQMQTISTDVKNAPSVLKTNASTTSATVELIFHTQNGVATRAAGDGFTQCTTGQIIVETINEAWNIVQDHYGTTEGFQRSMCLFERFLLRDERGCGGGQSARFKSFDVGNVFVKEKEFLLPPEVRNLVWPPQLRMTIESIMGRVARAVTGFDEREMRDFASSLTKCNWKTVSCSTPKRYTVATGFVLTQTLCLGTPVAAAVFGLNSGLVSLAITGGQLVSVPLFLYLVYDLSPMCFPSIPTCVFDDLFEEFDHWTPRYIQWPKGLVEKPWYRTATLKRLMKGAGVVDCREREYESGFDTFALILRRFGMSVPSSILKLFPEFARAVDRRERYEGEDSWCAVISTGPYALATGTATVYVVSACALPVAIYASSLVIILWNILRNAAKLLYEFR